MRFDLEAPKHRELNVGDFIEYYDMQGKERGIIIEKQQVGNRPFIVVFWIEAGITTSYSPPYFLISRLSK